MSQNSLRGCEDCNTAPVWDRACGGRGKGKTEKGLTKVCIPQGNPGSLFGDGEEVGASLRGQMMRWVSLVSHGEGFSTSYSQKTKKK